MNEVENPVVNAQNVSHWYEFLGQDRAKSYEEAKRRAVQDKDLKHMWHVHRYGEPCIEGISGCRVLQEEEDNGTTE
jgi:hypothetical protein